ncbi:MAG: DNA polymerase I [Zavarzinella sp.]
MANDLPNLYLVDTHALIFQMFHAIPPMNAPDGRATNAVFGVTRDLFYLYEQVKPTYLLCTFDREEPTFRDELEPSYKKNRPPTPPDLIGQVPLIQRLLVAMNLPVLSWPGFEADDVIATVATAAHERGIDVTICTSDKDCRQLIRDDVRMYNLRKKTVMDRAALAEDWGITPEQVIDYQTLVGDSTDNIKGVPGIGAKTATKLLQQFGSIAELRKRLDELKPSKQKENLVAAFADGTIERSRELVKLRTDVPMPLDWENWHLKPWNTQELLALCEELDFRTYARKAREAMTAQGKMKNNALMEAIGVTPRAADGQLGLFDAEEDNPFDIGLPEDTWKGNYTTITTLDQWQAFFAELQLQPRIAFDLETTSLDYLTCQVVGIAFSWQSETATYVPTLAPEGEQCLAFSDIFAQLKALFENPVIRKTNHNIKFDQLVLAANDIFLRGVDGDSMIAHYLIDSTARTHNLDDLTLQALHHKNIPIESLIGKGKKQKSMAEVPIAQVSQYAAEDADAAWRLTLLYEKKLIENQAVSVYQEMELPLISVLARMEATGICVDTAYLAKLSDSMQLRLEQLEEEIQTKANRTFNVSSLKQLREVLYDDLKLPVLKRTGLTNEASTDQDTLEKLAAHGHELPRLLIEHRQISKLKGTYVDALPKLVNPRSGRVHTSFNQTVAATGRLSSSDPNLQNIPTRTDLGREIRQAFIPQAGWVLLAADYSQIELRLLAHFSQDKNLLAAYQNGVDVHTQVASEIFGVPLLEVTSDMRRVAKTVNFGIIYGMSAYGLAERLHITRKEASKFIDSYFARYPAVNQYQDNIIARAKQDGFVSSILGRRRRFERTAFRGKPNYHSRNQAEREAINMEIQASAADLIKKAMLQIQDKLSQLQLQANMLLSVHDELVFEVHPTQQHQLATMLREEMCQAIQLTVPLEVDVQVGPNWLDTSEISS